MSGHQIILVFNQNYALEITIKLKFGHILYIFIDKLKIKEFIEFHPDYSSEAKMSGIFSKNVRDARSRDPAF